MKGGNWGGTMGVMGGEAGLFGVLGVREVLLRDARSAWSPVAEGAAEENEHSVVEEVEEEHENLL